MKMLEKEVQKIVRGILVGKNCLVIKIMVSSIIGTPDLLIIDPVLGVYFIECKSETGRLSPAQILMHKRLRERGARVFLIKGLNEARNTLLIVSGEYDQKLS
jgi:hypothetical protein